METFSFDLSVVPFSRIGSYLSFSEIDGDLYLRNLSGSALSHPELFKLELVAEEGILPFTTVATPSLLTLDSEQGVVEICIDDGDRVRVRGNGVGLRLSRYVEDNEFELAMSPDGDRWEVIAYQSVVKVGVQALSGRLDVDAPWLGSKSEHIVMTFLPENNMFEGCIETFQSVWKRQENPRNFDDIVTSNQKSYDDWLSTALSIPEQWSHGRMLACYINWSCTIEARGYHQRQAMLMSKNWMNKVWSWDHCFNALALIEQDPPLAWDQFILFFDHQDADGAIPDHLTDTTKSFRFYKPPIHGWTLKKLAQNSDIADMIPWDAVYDALVKWTYWWLTYRDDDNDGIPQYNHGNESGWDNGTAFSGGVPIECPDLTAYLIIQMDVLADIAGRLGRMDERQNWTKHANKLTNQLIEHFWNGEQFVAKHSGTHNIPEGDSSLVFMPLLLGERLSIEMQEKLIAGLRRFITPHGIATENPDSPYYESDGYWRGPIWAPSTYLLVDGLLACGEDELAHEVAFKFCEMANTNGMAENYDALTGVGLRDRAYTWTSSVFLLLGHMLYQTPLPVADNEPIE